MSALRLTLDQIEKFAAGALRRHGASEKQAAALAAGLDLAQRAHVVKAVDIENAVEVVDLVLERLAKEALALDAHVAALAVLRLDGDGPGALAPRPRGR